MLIYQRSLKFTCAHGNYWSGNRPLRWIYTSENFPPNFPYCACGPQKIFWSVYSPLSPFSIPLFVLLEDNFPRGIFFYAFAFDFKCAEKDSAMRVFHSFIFLLKGNFRAECTCAVKNPPGKLPCFHLSKGPSVRMRCKEMSINISLQRIRILEIR